MNQNFSKTIKNLPQKPGVYRFYDQGDTLIYIGKAKNLKNRVSSYFQKGRPHSQRLSLMIGQIYKIEYTQVDNEKESLILEANLINNLQPKYNIMLKDDRSYHYVRITSDKIPSIFITRKKNDSKSRYYGPYTSKANIREVLRALRIIFPFCQSRKYQDKPCQYFGIKQCDGICNHKETIEEYNKKIEQIENILKGKTQKAEEFIQSKISQAIQKEDFALASFWRDRLTLLTEILGKALGSQKAILPKPQDIDLITLATETGEDGLQIGSIFIQNIREGKIINVNNFLLYGSEEREDNLNFLERFMTSYYNYKPKDTPILVQSFEIE